MNCEEYSSFEGVSSDHRILQANILLTRNKKQAVKVSRYDRYSISRSDRRTQYTVTVRNKFDTLKDILRMTNIKTLLTPT